MQSRRTALATAGLLALVLAVAGVSVAWTGHHHYRLGGAFTGSGAGLGWNGLYIPLNPEGQKAAIRINMLTWDSNMAALAAAFGADTASDSVGEAEMMSHDAWKWTLVSYALKQGNPPVKCLIFVSYGTGKYIGVDSFNVEYTMDVYPAAPDANGDGLPDPGATALMTFPNLTGSAKRVPLP